MDNLQALDSRPNLFTLCSMIQILLTRTEIEAIERAFEIASASGQLPDLAIEGDAVRIQVLRAGLRKALEEYAAQTWGGLQKTQGQ